MEGRVDVIVIGAGIMGSAAAWQLAARGHEVALFEQFEFGHTRGSSHGDSRIYRLAYDKADYVSLSQAALPLWREAESALGKKLLYTTGGLDFGLPEDLSLIVAHLTDANIPFESLSRAEIHNRFPAYAIPPGWEALYQKDAGVLDADACRLGLVELARRRGTVVRDNAQVQSLQLDETKVIASTLDGRWRADHVVVATGAWTNRLLDPIGLHTPLRITREQVAYFRYREECQFVPFRWPARTGPYRIYGLPNGRHNEAKVAEHAAGPEVNPDTPEVTVPEREEAVRAFVRTYLPLLDDSPIRTETCLYAASPDDDFIIDQVGQITFGIGFGGHGFKFGAAIGAMLADLVEGKAVPRAERFSRSRLAGTAHRVI